MLYEANLSKLNSIFVQLDQEIDNIRLSHLRSIRGYVYALEQYNSLSTKLEDLQLQMDQVSQGLSSVVWFFNDKEISTRTLIQQNSDIYARWFNVAKHEWNNFNNNKGLAFKVPDQPLNMVLEKPSQKNHRESTRALNYKRSRMIADAPPPAIKSE